MNELTKFLSASDSAFSDAEVQSVKQEQNQGAQIDWSKLIVENVPDEEEPPALFNIYGVDVTPARAFSLVSAHKKNGKTNFAGILMSAAISPSGSVLAGAVRSNLGRLRVLYIDTEQPLKDLRRVLRRVMKTAGYGYDDAWTQQQLFVITIKDYDEDQRVEICEAAIREFKPQLVFIDGLADLTTSINDEQEAKDLTRKIDALASQYEFALIGMLHLNEGSSKIGGWAGTQSGKKYTDGFRLTKKAGYFSVEHEGRGESAPTLRFRIYCPPGDKFGWYENVDASEIDEMTDEDRKELELRQLLQQAPLPCSNTSLVSWVMQKMHFTDQSAAKRKLKKARELGLVDTKKEGRQSIWYLVKSEDDAD